MQGYNPSASLLPAGGGTIQAMSGGGMPPAYNPTATLLPSAGGEVAAYRGGFFADDTAFIGGNGEAGANSGTATPAAPPAANPPPGNGSAAPAPAAPAPAAPAPAAPAPAAPAAPAPAAPAAIPAAGNGPAAPAVAAASGNSTAASAPSAAPNASPNTKAIMLFGKSILLEDPKNIKGGVFTSAQKETLAVFGLDGPGLSDLKKKDILISLYEGQCNTDKSLIFQVDCEPMREIVQSLALTLLGKIKDNEAAGTENDAGNPRVAAERLQDGKFRVYIDFTPAQLPLLSKYKVEEFVKSKRTNRPKKAPTASAAAAPKPGQKIMEIVPKQIIGGGSDVITALGIENPKFWCYAIAAIQLMFSMPQLREAFSNLECTKPLSIPSDRKDIEALTTIEPDDTLCAVKWVLGELSQDTTKFSEADYASKIAGNKTIPVNTPVLYIMKQFLLEQKKSDKKATGDTNIQQDVFEFLRLMFSMIANSKLNEVLDIFKFNVIKTYKCEDASIKKEDSKPEPTLFLPLYIDNYNKNSSQELQNKKAKDAGGILLQNLIDYYSREQVPRISSTNPQHDTIDGCGPGGVGKGLGTYSEKIELNETNEYLIINPIKSTNPLRPSWQDTSVKIKADAMITVADNNYTIFGAILYNGSGAGGHYTYQRLYADGTANISADTDINKLPFIMYNTGTTTANNAQGYTILNNATLIIYKRVRGGGAAAAAAASSSNGKQTMSNAEKVDEQLTADEKTNMSITSARVREIAGATGLTEAKVREILKAKEIQESVGSGDSGPEAAPPEQQEQTLRAFIDSELRERDIDSISEDEKQRIITAAIRAGFTKQNVEAYFAVRTAPPASPAGTGAPAEPPAGTAAADPGPPAGTAAADAAAPAGTAEEDGAAAPTAPAAAAAQPAPRSPAGAEAPGAAAPGPGPATEGAPPASPSATNKQTGQGTPAPKMNKATVNELTRARQEAYNRGALERALKKAPKNRTANNIARIKADENKLKAAEQKQQNNAYGKLADAYGKATAHAQLLRESIPRLQKELEELKQASRGKAGILKTKQEGTKNYNDAKRNALGTIKSQQAKQEELTTAEKRLPKLEALLKQMEAKAPQLRPAQGGSKHRKTATKSKAKTKTFKKRPSKKRANKTFKRRK